MIASALARFCILLTIAISGSALAEPTCSEPQKSYFVLCRDDGCTKGYQVEECNDSAKLSSISTSESAVFWQPISRSGVAFRPGIYRAEASENCIHEVATFLSESPTGNTMLWTKIARDRFIPSTKPSMQHGNHDTAQNSVNSERQPLEGCSFEIQLFKENATILDYWWNYIYEWLG